MISSKLLKESNKEDDVVNDGVIEAKRKRESKLKNKLKAFEEQNDNDPFANF